MTGSAEYGCRGYSPGSECPWSWSLPRCPRHYQTPDQTSCNYLKGKRETPVNAHSMFLYTAHPSKHIALALPTDSDGIYFSLYLKSGLFTFENISHLFQLSLWDDKVILVLLVFLKGRQTWILDTDRKILNPLSADPAGGVNRILAFQSAFFQNILLMEKLPGLSCQL